MQKSAMANETETKTETQAALVVTQGDSVALAALLRCQSNAGFTPRTLNWEEGEDLLFCAIIRYHFGPRERRCWIDRSPFRIDTCGSPQNRIWRVERAAGRAAAIPGQSDLFAGGVSASNSADGSPPQPSDCVPVVLVAQGGAFERSERTDRN